MLPLLGLLAGLGLALSIRRQLYRDPHGWRRPYFPGLLLFELLVIVPSGIYLFMRYPAWSMLYWFSPADIPSWYAYAVPFGSALAAAFGMYLGAGLAGSRRVGLLKLAIVLSLIAVGLVFVLWGDRFCRLSSGVDWQEAPLVLTTELGILFAYLLPVILGGWFFLVILFSMEGRKIQRAAAILNLQSQESCSLPLPTTPAPYPNTPAPKNPPTTSAAGEK